MFGSHSKAFRVLGRLGLASINKQEKETRDMKILLSILAFAMTLTLANKSVAAGGGHGEGHGDGHKSAVHDPSEEMNKLFPPKKADPTKRVPPAKPELVSPEYHATVDSKAVELKWNEVEGATHYHVQVAKDPNFKWLVSNNDVVKGTSFKAEGLEAGKTYFWRVLTVNSNMEQLFTKSPFAPSSFVTK